MKRIVIRSIVSACFLFSSCTMSKYATNSDGLHSQKLISNQEFINSKAIVKTAEQTKINTVQLSAKNEVAMVELPKKDAVYNEKNVAQTTPYYKEGMVPSQIKSTINHVINRKNDFKIPSAIARIEHPKGVSDMNNKTWLIITFFATVVFFVLAVLFVHGTIGLIFGILLLLSFFALLIFLGLYLWEKHKEKMKK